MAKMDYSKITKHANANKSRLQQRPVANNAIMHAGENKS
jgi:hypothetical protein